MLDKIFNAQVGTETAPQFLDDSLLVALGKTRERRLDAQDLHVDKYVIWLKKVRYQI